MAAVRVIPVALALACLSQSGLSGPSTACPRFAVDTLGWQPTPNFAIGVELKLPRLYERMIWERRSDTLAIDADYWKEKRPSSHIRLLLVLADSAIHNAPARTEAARHCTLATRSGAAPAVLQETRRWIGSDKIGSLFSVEVQLPARDPRYVILFAAWSIDSAGFKEQVTIANSLRRLGSK